MFSPEARTAEAKTAEAKTAEAKPSAGVVDIRYAHRCLTRQQVDAANNSINKQHKNIISAAGDLCNLPDTESTM